MNRAVMGAAERDRELIADLAAERTGLHEAKVMGIRGLAAADKARLLGDEPKVLPVAIAARSGNREDALVDALPLTGVNAFDGDGLRRPSNRNAGRIAARGCSGFGRQELR